MSKFLSQWLEYDNVSLKDFHTISRKPINSPTILAFDINSFYRNFRLNSTNKTDGLWMAWKFQQPRINNFTIRAK